MKTWKPDTCDCKFEEIYNGTEIVGGGQVLNKCESHAGVADNELYDTVLNGENRVKNQMFRILLGLEEVKGLGLEEEKTNPDGSSAGLGLKQGVEYKWTFEGVDKDRKLTVEVVGAELIKAQKDSIKELCDTKFGAEKVTII